MKAKLITYSTERLSPAQRSILSKRINGYIDKSNKARYTYKREGILTKLPHTKVTNKTFIIRKQDFSLLSKEISKHKATLKSWSIEIKQI